MSMRLTPIIEGNDAGETLVFLQGWPDDASLWDDAVRALAPTHRCVRVNMPGYEEGSPPPRWGYTTEEIVSALTEHVKSIAHGKRVTLILHDWGSYWGHAVHHRIPDLVSRVVGLDVAPHFKPRMGEAAYILAYQSWLFGAFAMGGPLGDRMTQRFAKLAGAPGHACARASMNYPYRNMLGDLASGRVAALTKGYYPTCPILFVYGKNKPFPFHSEHWLSHVRASGGSVVALPCGHWVPKAPEFVPLLQRWLEVGRPYGPAFTD